MFMDHYIPNRLEGIRDHMVSKYLEDTEGELKPKQRELLTNAMSCLVYNISYSVSVGDIEFNITLKRNDFSLPIIYNGNRVKRKVSYVWFKAVLEWLQGVGMVSVNTGGIESFKTVSGRLIPDTKRTTVLHMSEELVELFKPVSSRYNVEILPNVLVLRDEDGLDLEFKVQDKHVKIIELLDMYNSVLKDTSISIGSDVFFIQGRKVYNQTWDKGGRCYLTGSKVMSHLLKRDNRELIEIDGEPTVELDFSSLHPRMIAEIEGVVLDNDFDPYGIQITNYDDKVLRKLAKIALLVLINCKSHRQASMALSMEAYKKLPLDDLKRSGKLPDPIGAKLIIQCVIERNQYAASWLGEGRGLELQNLDSKIVDYVIEKCLESGIVVIPLHDGFIVQNKHKESVAKYMKEGYHNVLGASHNCKIT